MLLTTLFRTAALLSVTQQAHAHMSVWSKSMYGVGKDFAYLAGDPVQPIGPNVAVLDDWWMRGSAARALPPQDGDVTLLPAGGTVTLDVACHVAWTRYGARTTLPGSPLDACPNNPGAYHADVNVETVDPSLLSGCALGIADVDDIKDVNWDNLVIFSVQSKCVQQKRTRFEIPAAMPTCAGHKCICAWFWLANTGTPNFYMTAFDCAVTRPLLSSNLLPPPRAISLPPSDPIFCPSSNTTCVPTRGAKRPLYAYNSPTNVPLADEIPDFNNNRPGYHESWSFSDGAQNDIFVDEDEDASERRNATAKMQRVTVAGRRRVSLSSIERARGRMMRKGVHKRRLH